MTLFGPDGSYWQFTPRSARDLALDEDGWASISFVLWRSSIGFRTDGSFARMRDAAKASNAPFAAYHWVYPTGKYSAQGQAEAMARNNPDTSIPVMLDWETESGLRPTIDDCDKVAAAMRAMGYTVPLLYTGAWYWSAPDIGSPTLAGRGYDLVLSDYNTNPNLPIQGAYAKGKGNLAGEWNRSLGGLKPVIWQFGSLVQFGGLNMDMNAFRGDRSDLGKWFKVWDKEPATPIDVAPDISTAAHFELPEGDDNMNGTATVWFNHQLHVFYRVDSDGSLGHDWTDGDGVWRSERLGGVLLSAPSASASADGTRLDVSVRGTDGVIWHTWWDGGPTWRPFEPIRPSA